TSTSIPTDTTTTSTVVTPPPSDTGAATTTTGSPAPPASGILGAFTVARAQRGMVIRGSIAVRQSGRLTLEALASKKVIGRAAPRTVPAGTRRFSITLSTTGRRALRRKGKLTI